MAIIMRKIMQYLKEFFLPRQHLCTIEEINTTKKYVVIYSKWISALIKLGFDEIIHEYSVICNLSPAHASWLGYYYGVNKHLYHDNGQENDSGINFRFIKGDARYQLVSQNRHGNITFLDKTVGRAKTMPIVDIISASNWIDNFTSVEACYLGVLFGIQVSEGHLKREKPFVSGAPLRIVK